MAQVILSSVGSALAGSIGGAVGRTLGAYLDHAAINALTPARQVGPRLSGLQLQSTAEGSPMPAVFGRARIAGQVIWAANFKEKKVEQSTGGGKGGPRTVSYTYSLSFAVAVCEGPIDGIGRIWADGQIMDMTGVVMRLHIGAEDQTPDPLIDAIEVSAPAYRGVAYVVFEDLALDAYGNRPPSLQIEVFHRPRGSAPTLEDRLGAVCLIPGAGEFVYATTPVLRRDGLTVSTAENVNNTSGDPDIERALDQLAAQLPNVRSVTLVVAWFGDDLRCGHCTVRPGVEQAQKATIPFAWRAGGVGRDEAHLVSRHDGGPAYGGTPADGCVIQAIRSLKARGYTVTLYPFLMMDVPPGNGLPDPYGDGEQAAYPWRGRITGSDKSAAATTEVAAFFGAAAPTDFTASDDGVHYHGPDEWSFRRFILANAWLAEAAGGVDSFLIGSELRGLTTLRNDGGAFPVVPALQTLAADCAAILSAETQIGYAADWSEYFGHQPADGSGDVFFHLDALWADPHLNFVGIDWYPPLADWRDGGEHLDALAGYGGPYDPAYLAASLAGGEGFDWFYASPADRLAQVRTPITDGAYDEPWVFRPKDLVNWWSNPHHDRPDGVRSAEPTAWAPGLKPIRLIEFGCPAVDKGSNAPNLFVDPKSAESRLPPFSDGARDDLCQRRALEALLDHFADPTNVPVIDGVAMLDENVMAAWCWDARPFPDFPARAEVWADAPNWSRGHWLNGRMGAATLQSLIQAVLGRGGLDPNALDLSGATGLIDGYVVDRPMSLSDVLAPLSEAYAFDLTERGGRICVAARDGEPLAQLGDDSLALSEGKPAALSPLRLLKPRVDLVNVRFINGAADYRTGSVAVHGEPSGGGTDSIDLPIVTTADFAGRVGGRRMRRLAAERDSATLAISPTTALVAEAGDVIAVGDDPQPWRILRVDVDEAPRLSLLRLETPDVDAPADGAALSTAPVAKTLGPPACLLLDLPPLEGAEDDARPLAAVAAEPWRGFDLFAGPSEAALTPRASVSEPATLGRILSDLAPGPLYRFDHNSRLQVAIEGGVLVSASEAEVLNGANALALACANGEWEVMQYLDAELISPGVYSLSGLLRGQAGTEVAMQSGAMAGAKVVVLNRDLVRANVAQSERGLPLVWRAAPTGAPTGGLAMTEAGFTWTALALRPFSPCHLKKETLADGGLRFSWIRRTRIGGDPWLEGEAPLSEAAERYRLDILNGDGVVRSLFAASPTIDYDRPSQGADFSEGQPPHLTVEVRQYSDTYGWGAPLRRVI